MPPDHSTEPPDDVPAHAVEYEEGWCETCGREYRAAVGVLGRFRIKSRHCPECVAANERKLRGEEPLRDLAQRREEAWRRVCPPEYRDTDPERLRQLVGEEIFQGVMGWPHGGRGASGSSRGKAAGGEGDGLREAARVDKAYKAYTTQPLGGAPSTPSTPGERAAQAADAGHTAHLVLGALEALGAEARAAEGRAGGPGAMRPGLGIIGHTGRGKTRLMFLLLRARVLAGEQVRYLNAVNLADELASVYSRGCDEAERWMRDVERAPLLFVDDLGKEKLTERVETFYYRCMEHRTAHQLPIYFTSNLNGDELLARWDAAATAGGFWADRAAPTVRRLREARGALEL